MKRICLLTAGILTLSACENAAKNQSTGFSGLGSEPTVAQADYLDPRLNTGTLYSDIPSRAVRSGSANRADHAELVIRKASGSGWRSKAVTVDGELHGDVEASERVLITANGSMRGNIQAPRVILEDGSKFKGSIDMNEAAPTKSFGVVSNTKVAASGDSTGE